MTKIEIPGKTGETRIVISEWMDAAGRQCLTGAGLTVHYDPDLYTAPDRLRELLVPASGLIVRNRTQVDRQLVARAPRLRVVGRLGAGLDNVNVDQLHQQQIQVTYAPASGTEAVAEYAVAAMLSLARRLPQLHQQTAGGSWDRRPVGLHIRGKRLGILGLGRIGLAVARRAGALGLMVQSWHPRRAPDDPEARAAGVSLISYDHLLATSHIISLHLPLTPETSRLIDEPALDAMKPGVLLINAGRGGVLDEKALAAALAAGKVAGAALDVREKEPPGRDDPLAPHTDRLLLTPHIAALTPEAQRDTALTVAEDVLRVLAGQRPQYPAGGQAG